MYHFRTMSLKDWERDVVNRQRNIVFPDTNLNEGRFYRNIFSGKAPLNSKQRIGIFLIAAMLFFLGCFGLADPVRSLLMTTGGYSHAADVIFGTFWLGVLLCGIAFAMKAILPNPQPARKRRRGYRQSNKA